MITTKTIRKRSTNNNDGAMDVVTQITPLKVIDTVDNGIFTESYVSRIKEQQIKAIEEIVYGNIKQKIHEAMAVSAVDNHRFMIQKLNEALDLCKTEERKECSHE